jgi:hypothetical protein
MITFIWNCETVDIYSSESGLSDVVYNVHWIVSGTDDLGNTVTNIGTQMLETSNIVNFIPLAELTYDQIVSWTKSAMGYELVDLIENDISYKIRKISNPTSVTVTINK